MPLRSRNLFRTSIHFPHPREDRTERVDEHDPEHFNPLPSSEGRHKNRPSPYRNKTLQSTSLIRGKTLNTPEIIQVVQNFNPLPSSEGRRYYDVSCKIRGFTSIHFPHPREDFPAHTAYRGLLHFNPLPSSEGRPTSVTRSLQSVSLQSTSLIRGKTIADGLQQKNRLNFNPLPSSEGRHRISFTIRLAKTLQSTSLIRGMVLEYK